LIVLLETQGRQKHVFVKTNELHGGRIISRLLRVKENYLEKILPFLTEIFIFGFFCCTHAKSDERSEFGSCEPSHLPERSIGEFGIYDNFFSTHQDLSALKISNFLIHRFRKGRSFP
jgi:hypothetical protein